MKYYIKCDVVNGSILVIPAIISIIILGVCSNKIFEIKQAILFVVTIYGPILIGLFVFIGLTNIEIKEQGIRINYGNIVTTTIKYENIKAVEERQDGFGLLALNKDKILITTDKSKYLLSPENQSAFSEELKGKIAK